MTLTKILNNSLAGKIPAEAEIKFLLNIEKEEDLKKLCQTANKIKERIYGKRIVLFAPLYLSNECVNNCLYCAFRHDNKAITRKTLTLKEIVTQAKALENAGYKRILLVASENPKKCSLKYLTGAVKAIYKNTGIRIVHINCAPFSKDEFKKLKKSGIGVYQLFQETYHSGTYKKMHPQGRKKNIRWRLNAIERSIEAGIKDVGIGALLGLYDYKYEVLEIIKYARRLEKKYNSGPHTISVPRLRPATGAPLKKAPYPVSDFDFKKIVAVLRLAVPYTGIVVTTRESGNLRNEIIHCGASQISAGSHTEPGGYDKNISNLTPSDGQFSISDTRPVEEVINSIISEGFIPSLCTSCYRVNRTGENFVPMARKGVIKDFCFPNALLTLEEYAIDCASPKTKKRIKKLIKENIKNVSSKLKNSFIEKLDKINQGKRDLYF